MTRSITIHDVAREAAVSTATVSNAMNHPGRVAAETRAKVLEAADRLGYVPYAVASERARARRRRIGIVAPFSSYSSYAMRMRGVLAVVGADRMETIIFDHPSASRSPSPRLESLPFSGDLDGLVIMGIPVDAGLCDRLIDRELPTVLVDSFHPQLTSVVLDEAHGTRLVADHLVARGFDRFVYVTEGQVSTDYISQGRKRQAGFVQALSDHGVPDESIHRVRAKSGDVSAGRAAAEYLARLARGGSRVGVLAGHDTLAAGVLAGLRDHHVAVPDRIGVVGWDGGETIEALGLTTVRQPLEQSGRIGAERLLARMDDARLPVERVVLRPSLHEGVTS